MIALAWIFSFSVGSLVFTVTDLRKNHECTYEFCLARVAHIYFNLKINNLFFQGLLLSNVIFLFLSIIIVFSFYGEILSKFYKRRKKLNIFQRELKDDFQPKLKKISFTKSYNNFFPISKTVKTPENKMENGIDLKHFRSTSEEGKETVIKKKEQTKRKESNLSKHLTFHASYLKSSNYILVTLFAFCLFHTPIFVYEMIVIVR